MYPYFNIGSELQWAIKKLKFMEIIRNILK